MCVVVCRFVVINFVGIPAAFYYFSVAVTVWTILPVPQLSLSVRRGTASALPFFLFILASSSVLASQLASGSAFLRKRTRIKTFSFTIIDVLIAVFATPSSVTGAEVIASDYLNFSIVRI
jgi:hypothetical protein